MKKNNIFALLGIAACCCLASCDNSQQKMADSLLKEAEQGQWQKTSSLSSVLPFLYLCFVNGINIGEESPSCNQAP